MVEAMIAAHEVNIMEAENRSSIIIPTGLFLPKKKINKNPMTVGGKTIGKIRRVSISILPLKFLFENNLPKRIPKINTMTTETDAIFKDNKMGDQNSF
jgi:hypothetical protein